MKKVYLNILCLLVLTSYSYNSYAVDVNPKKTSNLKSYEFGELIKSYMLNNSSSTKWNYNTNSQNIVWDTGIDWNSYSREYDKSGYIRINFDNYKLPESSFENTKKVRSEAAWAVTYSGNSNKNVNRVNFDHGETAGMLTISENERVKPFKSLIKEGITYKPVCLYKMEAGDNYSIAYELSAENKKDAYLIQTSSEGSGGLSIFYSLFYQKEDMSKYFKAFHELDDFNHSCLVL